MQIVTDKMKALGKLNGSEDSTVWVRPPTIGFHFRC